MSSPSSSVNALDAPPGRGGQPPAVWAVLAASVVAFMGIGLVDPILPVIGKGLDASHSQIELLFTSYFLIIGLSNLLTGFVSSRLGDKKTLLTGLALVIVFSALAGQSGSVEEVVLYRAGWGLGIALFISTTMSVIIGHANGGQQRAVTLFESALGIGISTGPLLGALLGNESWRAPFFGVAVLMAVAFAVVHFTVPATPPPAQRTRLSEPLRALTHKGLATAGVVALFWNFGFFTLLAYTPLLLDMGVYQLGATFFAWGVLVAVSAVWIAPAMLRRWPATNMLGVILVVIVAILLVIGFGEGNEGVLVPAIVISGLPLGIGNSLLSNLLFGVSHTDPADAAAATNFIRFTGGAISPFLAGKLSEEVGASAPLYVSAGVVALALVVLVVARSILTPAAQPGGAPDADRAEAETEHKELAAV
ncbi:MAG: MFS transporter [Patulibacter minatonensis]